jgi:hypothetical protein
LKRTAPYNERELFTIWQSELPGVGPIYEVSRTMLRGVAVCTGDSCMDVEMSTNDNPSIASTASDREWHYLPVELMSMDGQKCFDALFHIKDRFTMYELEPYLQHLIDTLPNSNGNNVSTALSSSMTELLLRYTKLTTQVGLDGETRTFYERK